LTKSQWDKTPKIMNPDGTPKTKESFVVSTLTTASKIAVVGILLVIGYGFLSRRAK
jgi:hypothetical protein